MISFLLIVGAGLIRIIAAMFLQRLNLKRGEFITVKENKKKIIIIKIVDFFGLGLILLAILFAVVPSLRKLQ